MPNPNWHNAVIGLGANLGNARQTLGDAVATLQANPSARQWQISSFYTTAPIGSDTPQPDYINAVACFQTDLSPTAVLSWLMDTECRFGRQRDQDTPRNSARTLDLDLLLFDERILQTPTLTLPHPRMHERAFVLIPLHELLPTCIIPGQGPVQGMLRNVQNQKIERYNEKKPT